MKKLKFLLLPFVCLVMAINFVSCDKDDDPSSSKDDVNYNLPDGLWKLVNNNDNFNQNWGISSLLVSDNAWVWESYGDISDFLPYVNAPFSKIEERFKEGWGLCVCRYDKKNDLYLLYESAYSDWDKLCYFIDFINVAKISVKDNIMQCTVYWEVGTYSNPKTATYDEIMNESKFSTLSPDNIKRLEKADKDVLTYKLYEE